MRKMMFGVKLLTVLMLAAALAPAEPVTQETATPNSPWWKKQKLRFMWGQWDIAREDKTRPHRWGEVLPRDLFRNLAQAGGTVFVASREHQPENARLAHEFGLKYFATKFNSDLPHIRGRNWIKENGEPHRSAADESAPYYKCPLDESVYGKWLVEPHLQGVRDGLIDGIHTDWEYYSGNGDAKGPCYCDNCFAAFLTLKQLEVALPEKPQRFALLRSRGLDRTYDENFHARRVEMFARLAQKLRAANPNLLFSSYGAMFSDFTRGVHTPKTPLIVLDAFHYYNDDRQPWWESYSARLKAEGYLYIPGGWTNSLFGAQASQVSAARWIYEAAINEDGCWLWFERELDDEILRAYSTADREIKAVENKVGEFLFSGERDPHFATAVEWTGRPQLAQAVLTQTYHLRQQQLTHVQNVNAEWPLRTRIRFPRLENGKQWTVRDPLAGLFYTRDGKSHLWNSSDLSAGVVVALDPRSDLFLSISRADGTTEVAASNLLPSAEFSTLPAHAAASQPAAGRGPDLPPTSKPAAAAQTAPAPPGGLVFTATAPMGFEGPEGLLTIGNAIHAVDRNGGDPKLLRQLRGHLWSPRFSPDNRRIAFVHDAGGLGQIYTMNSDGANAVNISNNAFCDRAPVWSPAGDQIAFLSDRSGDWDIFVMNADGSGQRRLAGNKGLDLAPAWSPDGKRLAWQSHVAGIGSIWICDASGDNSQPLIAPDKPVVHEPYEVGGPTAPQFPDNSIYLRNPVWSPDGKRIAAAGLWSVLVVDADGSRVLEAISWMMGLDQLAWSPDGTQLAGTMRTGPAETERSGIFIVKPGERKYRWLVNVGPDGPRLGGAERHGLNTWYSHGSAQPRRVVKTFASLSWLPDGSALSFSSDMDASGAFYIYTVPADGGKPTRLDSTKSAWQNDHSWRN